MARTVSCNETRQLTSTGKLNPLLTGFEMHKTQVMCITQGHITPLSCKLRHLTCCVARARARARACVCVCVCVCACARARLCDVGCTYSCTAHGLACYCCCTVLASFFFSLFFTARRSLVYTRGSHLISISLSLLLLFLRLQIWWANFSQKKKS